MLKIHFGSLRTEIRAVDTVFNIEQEPDWFEDPFVLQMIQDIDGVAIQPNGLMVHPYFGVMQVANLSTGVKNLILAYKLDRIIDASRCGDNCAKWLLKIAEKKDLHITLCHLMDFSRKDPNMPFQCYITNNHKYVNDLATYAEEGTKFIFKHSEESL